MVLYRKFGKLYSWRALQAKNWLKPAPIDEFANLFSVSWPASKCDKSLAAVYQISVDEFHICAWRPTLAPGHQLLDCVFIALCDGFHTAVITIAHPAIDFQCLRDDAHRFSKAYALHTTRNGDLDRNSLTVPAHSS